MLLTNWRSLLLQALRFSRRRGERETRVTGDEPQGNMGRVQTAGEARLARCLLPAFLCAHIFIERETSGYEAATGACHIWKMRTINHRFYCKFDWKRPLETTLIDVLYMIGKEVVLAIAN